MLVFCSLYRIIHTVANLSDSYEEVLGRMSDVDDDDDQDLLPRDKEPEAWSVTVDMKTLKRMNNKDIKRQDHIWGSLCVFSVDGRVLRFSPASITDLHVFSSIDGLLSFCRSC